MIVQILGALALLLVVTGTSHAHEYRHGAGGILLPNAAVTPGATRPLTKAETCSTAWGRDRRHVTVAMKRTVCRFYGLACPVTGGRSAHAGATRCTGKASICHGGVEIDHLIPRELGGADDVRNLWPQPWTQARKKDTLENFLHRSVCAGHLSLPDAQEAIRSDWARAYRAMTPDEGPRR